MKNYKYFVPFSIASIAVLLASNIIAGRLVQVGPIVATSAMFLFPISYIINDLLGEVYGYVAARKMIWWTMMANAIMTGIFLFALQLPVPGFFEAKAAYDTVLGMVPRVVIASVVAYWAGSFMNAATLARMKEWMVKWDPNHKHLWMRTISSTIVGEGVDSLLFIFGSFLFVLPLPAVVMMFVVQWWIKVGVEAVMTPITYVVCKKVKQLEEVDVVGTDTYNPFKV